MDGALEPLDGKTRVNAARNRRTSASLTTAPGLAHPNTAAAAKRVEPGCRRRGGSGGRNVSRLDSLHLHIVELCPLVVGATFASLRAGEEGAELRMKHRRLGIEWREEDLEDKGRVGSHEGECEGEGLWDARGLCSEANKSVGMGSMSACFTPAHSIDSLRG